VEGGGDWGHGGMVEVQLGQWERQRPLQERARLLARRELGDGSGESGAGCDFERDGEAKRGPCHAGEQGRGAQKWAAREGGEVEIEWGMCWKGGRGGLRLD
jgi:hypothetical protein